MSDTRGDHDQRDGPGSRDDASRAANDAAGEPGGCDKQECARKGKEQLGRILVRGPGRSLVREFRGIRIGRELTISLTPDATAAVPETVLSGVEVLAEGW